MTRMFGPSWNAKYCFATRVTAGSISTTSMWDCGSTFASAVGSVPPPSPTMRMRSDPAS